MSQTALVPPRSRSIPYALPPDALEGLLRLAAHVAITETAVLFFQQGQSYWVLATSGVSMDSAHTASLLLEDVLEADASEFTCLDAASGTEPVNLMATALTGRPGFLLLNRFAVDSPGCYAILALAHSVARPQVSEEMGILLSEIARQIALRMAARAEKRELEESRKRRSQRDRFLAAITEERCIGQCLLDDNGCLLSISESLIESLELEKDRLIGKRFEQVFAFESAFRDESTTGAETAQSVAQVRVPWERVLDVACLHKGNDGHLVRLTATASVLRFSDESTGWCVMLARADEDSMSALNTIRRHQKVLIAEDHPVNQRVIQGMVEKLGLTADVVANGLEAVHAVCHEKYAAVLMDCQMPDMDGIEATRFIRGNEDRIGRVPIVAVTAFGHEEDRQRCFEAGVDEFMVKPIRIETLARVLAQWTSVTMEPEILVAEPSQPVAKDHLRRDLEQAFQRLSVDLDPELVREVVALFLEDTQVRIEEMRRLAEVQERIPLRSAAHKVKGSCGSLGARALMDECERLEQLAQTGARDQIESAVDGVERQFRAIVPVLREFLEGSI